VNAAAERAEPESVFHHYRRLIALRHDDPVVALGDFTMLLPDHEHVYAFTRSLDGVTLTVLGNFSGTLQETGLDDLGELILSNYAAPAPELRPWEARVYRRTGGLPPL
jgi:oligo-1,6-glucosidase